jgi:hypothetical protein
MAGSNKGLLIARGLFLVSFAAAMWALSEVQSTEENNSYSTNIQNLSNITLFPEYFPVRIEWSNWEVDMIYESEVRFKAMLPRIFTGVSDKDNYPLFIVPSKGEWLQTDVFTVYHHVGILTRSDIAKPNVTFYLRCLPKDRNLVYDRIGINLEAQIPYPNVLFEELLSLAVFSFFGGIGGLLLI